MTSRQAETLVPGEEEEQEQEEEGAGSDLPAGGAAAAVNDALEAPGETAPWKKRGRRKRSSEEKLAQAQKEAAAAAAEREEEDEAGASPEPYRIERRQLACGQGYKGKGRLLQVASQSPMLCRHRSTLTQLFPPPPLTF